MSWMVGAAQGVALGGMLVVRLELVAPKTPLLGYRAALGQSGSPTNQVCLHTTRPVARRINVKSVLAYILPGKTDGFRLSQEIYMSSYNSNQKHNEVCIMRSCMPTRGRAMYSPRCNHSFEHFCEPLSFYHQKAMHSLTRV